MCDAARSGSTGRPAVRSRPPERRGAVSSSTSLPLPSLSQELFLTLFPVPRMKFLAHLLKALEDWLGLQQVIHHAARWQRGIHIGQVPPRDALHERLAQTDAIKLLHPIRL